MWNNHTSLAAPCQRTKQPRAKPRWINRGALYNVEGVVLRGDSPVHVLLGMSFLSRINMQREGEVMVLRRNQ